jgi:hypothetical protein
VIAEAIDAATIVARALAVWIVLAAAVLTAALFAVVAAGWVAWRSTVAAAKAVRAWLRWRHTSEVPPQAPPEGAPAPEVAHARSRPAPAWARKDKEIA